MSMGMMKNYLLNLLHLCSEHQFGQDAVEWAIANGQVKLSYDFEADLRLIMGEPGKPETGMYDAIILGYRNSLLREWADGDSVLLAAILQTT
jgi:hypothetical protein